MQRLRADFLKGVRPKECATCWKEEAAGLLSYRQNFAIGRIEDSNIDFRLTAVAAPTTLDLKLSNVCNLKCRICGPVASSPWVKEELDNGATHQWIKSAQTYHSNKITEDEDNLQTFKSWIPYLTHVEILGGEPLLSKENREIEKLMIDEGYASRISLSYNTNITIFKEDMIEQWKKFKSVTLCLSLDDIGPRFEYQRFPSQWSKIENHVLRYAAIHEPGLRVVLFCSVSFYNIWYIPEYMEWASRNCPHLEIHFNIVHNDPEFCVVNIPVPLKEKIAARLLAASKLDISKHPIEARNRGKIMEVVSFLLSREPEFNLWKQFCSITDKIDRRRAQAFGKVFPELAMELLLARVDLPPTPNPTAQPTSAKTRPAELG